jgi:Leucine-rich repeat (LRR) protein
LRPCFCDADIISCGGTQNIDLNYIFHKISFELRNGNNHFKEFKLNNTGISELKESTFEDITFESIKIEEASNLSIIHKNAFNVTNIHLKELYISNTSLKNFPPNNDIFTAISLMPNIESVQITNSLIEEIPDNAFRPLNGEQTNLTKLYLFGNKIKRIGNNAFEYLTSLKRLELYSNDINHISDKAFNFLRTSEKHLSIGLNDCLLNSSSFQVGAFDHLKRPTIIYFDYSGDIKVNKITFLDQHVFQSFLNNNDKNEIVLTTIDCNDCRSFWFFNNQKFSQQITKLKCESGKQFSQIDNFRNCSK